MTTVVNWFCWVLLIACITALPYNNWTEHNSPLLPRTISHCAMAHDPSKHRIFIVGDITSDSRQQLISFNYLNDTLTDYGDTYFARFNPDIQIYGYSQNYAQIESILYLADPYEPYLNSFNVETMVLETNYSLTPLDFDGRESCIVNIRNEYIAVLGDKTNVQILNILSQDWMNSVPLLQIKRSQSSCIYLNDKMFNIGGLDTDISGVTSISSIEYLNVSSASMVYIGSMSWVYNRDSLPLGIKQSRCITVDDDVLVIGGMNAIGSNKVYQNTIYVIDSISESVSLGGYLVQAGHSLGVFIVNNIIYSFGGWIGSSQKWNKWQTHALLKWNKTTLTSTTMIISETPDTDSTSITETTISSKTSTQDTTNSIQTVTAIHASDTESTYITDQVYNYNIYINISNETIISIILNITDDSVSISDVLDIVSDTLTNYLIDKSIVNPLDTQVIPQDETSTILIVFSIFHELDKDEINRQEIEDKLSTALDDEYDGKVKVNDVAVTVVQYDGSDNEKDADARGSNLWFIIIGIVTSIVCVVLILIVLLRVKKNMDDNVTSSKHMDDNINDVQKQGDNRNVILEMKERYIGEKDHSLSESMKDFAITEEGMNDAAGHQQMNESGDLDATTKGHKMTTKGHTLSPGGTKRVHTK